MQFTKKTSSSQNIIRIVIKLGLVTVLILGAIFLLNKIDFPTPYAVVLKTNMVCVCVCVCSLVRLETDVKRV